MKVHFAHTKSRNPDTSTWHPLEVHLRQTATLAKQFASAWDAGDWAYLAGLWHDVGKYSADFQERLRILGGDDAHIENASRVDHSTAGAQHAFKVLKENGYGKALGYIIAGHHGGLPDGLSTDSCLKSRLDKVIPDYSECPHEILEPLPLALPLTLSSARIGFQVSFFIRMLYSALVDADFLDTEAFIDAQRGKYRSGYKKLPQLEEQFFQKLTAMQDSAATSSVNSQRHFILTQCIKASEHKMGLFSLTVPTGGGKTLSSMAFALKHAAKYGLKRIIYVIPYTSIIEQNAAVFRDILGKDVVLEHHSNFEPESEDHRSRLAAENWDAPIIVTTNVQFFESLFASRSSRCRKLHNIAESVVILDEVQTLPAPFLLPCLEALKELSSTYRTSIVLCTATQPAVQWRPDFTKGLENVTEIIADPRALAHSMKRTEVTALPRTADSELIPLLREQEQVLCVVNTRKHAKVLYSGMQGLEGLYHLSALMCPVHRSHRLAEIKQRLGSGLPCRVISTQLIEAGVDIDFPVVFRSLAGIDSIAQAAGRCNREGKLRTGKVFVFTPEAPIPAGHLRQTSQAAESVVRKHADDIMSLAAIEYYFKLYYWNKGEDLDQERVLNAFQAGALKGDFPFKSVAEKFRLIKDEMKPVLIPFDNEARRLISTLEYLEHPASLSRSLQKYTVSIYPQEWNRLLSLGCIAVKAELFPVLVDEQLYNMDTGLNADDPTQRDPESLYM